MHEGPTENRLGELGSLYKYYYYYLLLLLLLICIVHDRKFTPCKNIHQICQNVPKRIISLCRK